MSPVNPRTGLWAALVGLVLTLACAPTEESSSQAPASAQQTQAVTGLVKRSQVSGGVRHSLAIKPDGTVWAWGSNAQGQVGDGGALTSRTAPVPVAGLTAMKEVAAGFQHSLALGTNGQVFAWGSNSQGQLGAAPSSTLQPVPAQVTAVSEGVDLAAGLYHSMLLKADGTVWTWGSNSYGQLGKGASTPPPPVTPSPVPGLSDVVAVAAGAYHSLALRSDGTVWAWGHNTYGQLGIIGDKSSVPVQVPGLSGVVAIAAGYYHSLALGSDGKVWTWGDNFNGQLGDGNTAQRSAPASVITGVVSLGGGGSHTLVLKEDGTVWAWGYNANGQLGVSTAPQPLSRVPVQVPALTNIVALDGGDSHSLAQGADGKLYAWGLNTWGQVGNGGFASQPAPVQVLAGAARGMVTAGIWFSYVLRADGTVWGWGLNDDCHQLGDPSAFTVPTPVQLTGIGNVRALSAGGMHVLALRTDGTVWGWGQNGRTQLGNGSSVDSATPTRAGTLSHVAAVSAGFDHSLALRSDGTVWAWGYNDQGQVGDGSTESVVRFVPVQVQGLTGVVAVDAGRSHSLALRSDGTVWAWGDNSLGQLGNGSTTASSLPVQVQGLSGAVAVSAGAGFSLALRSDGTVWSWGGNGQGQLGNGQWPTASSVPTQVVGLTQVVALAHAFHHALALRADGSLWGWGLNDVAQVTDATQEYPKTPVQLTGPGQVVSLAGGNKHSLVMKADGTVWAWGGNGYGQLGDGTQTSRATPIQVPLPP